MREVRKKNKGAALLVVEGGGKNLEIFFLRNAKKGRQEWLYKVRGLKNHH